MKRGLLVLLVACTMLGAACGGAKPVGPPPPPTLTVIDAGTEPRRVVRYELALHAQARSEAHVDLTITSGFTNTVLESAASRVAYPTITLQQHEQVIEVAADRSAKIAVDNERATYTGEISDPKVRTRIEHVMLRLRQSHQTYWLSPSGARSQIESDHGPATKKREGLGLDDADRGTGVTFPDTPIGVGATWRVVSHSGGAIDWQSTVTYHLRALDDASASVELELTEGAEPQALAVDPKSSIKLTEGTGTSTGQFLIPLRGLGLTGGSHKTETIGLSIVDHALRIQTKQQYETGYMVRPAPEQ